jgi:hypothetical protein
MNKLLQELARFKVLAGILNENELYHSTFSSAVQTARAYAESKGYTIDETDWFNSVNTGPGKPQSGQTTRATVGLSVNGKLSKKALHIQVYNRGNEIGNNLELNYYIS